MLLLVVFSCIALCESSSQIISYCLLLYFCAASAGRVTILSSIYSLLYILFYILTFVTTYLSSGLKHEHRANCAFTFKHTQEHPLLTRYNVSPPNTTSSSLDFSLHNHNNWCLDTSTLHPPSRLLPPLVLEMFSSRPALKLLLSRRRHMHLACSRHNSTMLQRQPELRQYRSLIMRHQLAR